MVSALLSRSSALAARSMRAQAPRGTRALHVENTAETSLPFGQGPKNKVAIAVCLTTFLSVGFGLPFYAARFQIKKAGGGA
ncbi:hypothetical protein FA09DRAFT_338391 [Tilletiopsis washingtonensis]|uniref:Cytochrome c oxidase subunit 8, mitochondrial n=1 Tax=Tilletiopsis washingtonensis TaxID=58919 RepID=A0A316ZB61_9BASI|nr:hypothetical protein FA09DRAFT_338391 [Tilletiopsis washingtonensis]PWN98536.1 hypothetical protein FA09DRAFT_338391 [Tilletiopsis washingtonensis]